MSKLKNYVTCEEAAQELGIEPNTVRKHCQSGLIRAEKFATAWLIPRAEVAKYAKKRRPSGRPPKK